MKPQKGTDLAVPRSTASRMDAEISRGTWQWYFWLGWAIANHGFSALDDLGPRSESDGLSESGSPMASIVAGRMR